MTESREPVEPASYLIRVQGALGPVLLTALTHRDAVHTHAGCTVVTHGTSDDIVDVVIKLLGTGVDVESVREVTPPRQRPDDPRPPG